MEITNITGSSHVEISTKDLPKEVLKHKPKIGEASLQRLDDTNVCQWHYRTRVYWIPFGPLFRIED